jgi:hypothetical protein
MNDHKPVTPAQRLAAITAKCFKTRTGETKDALRHAAYSKAVGREIKSSADLTDDEIKWLLQVWEHHESPFCPSDRAMKECNEYADAYQREHGQSEMELPTT